MVDNDQNSDSLLSPSEHAHAIRVHPSSIIRWMKKGALLADGRRVYLKHMTLPLGYRIRQSWMDEFLQALADGRSSNTPETSQMSSKSRSAQMARVHAALVENGLADP